MCVRDGGGGSGVGDIVCPLTCEHCMLMMVIEIIQ
jgi:hypothetical protein